VGGVADPAAARPLVVRFEYRVDRVLSAKLEQSYAVLVPDHRWPVSPAAPVVQEPVHEHPRRHLRARVVGSSA
jgi:hypothetical protein